MSCENSLLEKLQQYQEVYWENPHYQAIPRLPLPAEAFGEAAERLQRFAPYLAIAFPQTAAMGGLIESELREIPQMAQALCPGFAGKLLLKCDHALPISGSIKARGGIYEVLKFAEQVALAEGLLKIEDNYAILAQAPCHKVFSHYQIAVGSTGNLGLSIGIIGAALGFCVTVHMSADARQWKKDLLRAKGVLVAEHQGSYEKAVAAGRLAAQDNPYCHFIDDERSLDLFCGYGVAASRLSCQLTALQITVDEAHPLCVYLPCGVGGGPGGVAYGLKQIYGAAVHCFFAEPTHAPAMLLGLATGKKEHISVQELGLDGKTAADGLAVGRPSSLVSSLLEPLLDGCFTVSDEHLYYLLAQLFDQEGIFVEPSACAGFPGFAYHEKISQATHLVWSTGGTMVPAAERSRYYALGKEMKMDFIS